MIIDMRCRLTTTSASGYFRAQMQANATSSVIEGTEAAFWADLDRAGVTVAVSVSGQNPGMKLGPKILADRTTTNDDLAAFQNRFPERFVGVAGIDVSNTMHDSSEELVRSVNELGLRVATIEPGRAPWYAPNPADRRLYPFYEQAEALGVPLVIQTSGLKGGKNIDYAHPRWIDQLAEDFPQLRIICGHGCAPFVRELIFVVGRREHVYASPDMYLFFPGGQEWVQAVNQFRWMADKFLFASGYPLCRDLKSFVDRFMALEWKPEVLDRILYRNAIRALGLEENPYFGTVLRQPDIYVGHQPIREQAGPVLPRTPLENPQKRSLALPRRVIRRLARIFK